MEPRFSDEDEGRILILQDLEKVKGIARDTFNIPGQVFDVFTMSGIRDF